MTLLFKYVAWIDLAFNLLSLLCFFVFSDRIGYKIQTFGLVYLFIILGLIGLSAIGALSTLLSARVSTILGCVLFIPSGINVLFMLGLISE